MKIKSRESLLMNIDKHKSGWYDDNLDLVCLAKLPLNCPKCICVIFKRSIFTAFRSPFGTYIIDKLSLLEMKNIVSFDSPSSFNLNIFNP